jgi:hypothetical protein
MSKRMLLRNKLIKTHSCKTDTIASYLMKITELRDQQVAIGNNIEENELVWISVNGFGPSWHQFVHHVCACEHLPSFKKPAGCLC